MKIKNLSFKDDIEEFKKAMQEIKPIEIINKPVEAIGIFPKKNKISKEI